MKKLLFFAIIISLTYSLVAQKRQTVSFTADTISTSSSVDTITFSAGSFSTPVYYEWYLQADSLSGSTNATAYLQVAAPGTSNYVTIETITVDGVLTTSRKTGDYLGAGAMRLRIIAPSGTQSTRVKASAVFSPKLE